MIELERDESQDTQVWADEDFSHVIVEETEDTYRFGSGGPGFYLRDEDGEEGPFRDLADAFDGARFRWHEVELAPANRLRHNIEVEDECDAGNYLLEYLATYGAVGIDAKALATRAFERIEEG
jgi:hypothetical protein